MPAESRHSVVTRFRHAVQDLVAMLRGDPSLKRALLEAIDGVEVRVNNR
jgi:hypothetical protein